MYRIGLLVLRALCVVVATSVGLAPALAQTTVTLDAERLPPSFTGDLTSFDGFGNSIAMDGTTAVIGAPLDEISQHDERGSVLVFELEAGAWVLAAKLLNPVAVADVEFGRHVDISGDRIVIDSNHGVFVYERNGGTWSFQQQLTDWPASEVSIDSDTVVLGDVNNTRALVFVRTATGWSLQASLVSPSSAYSFGADVTVDGDTLAVSSGGWAEVFVRSGTSWTHQQLVGENPALAVPKVDIEGDRLGVAIWGSGIPLKNFKVYERTGTTWSQTMHETFANPYVLELSVDLAGDRVAFGSSIYNGYSFIETYDYANGEWSKTHTKTLNHPGFGAIVAVEGDQLLVSDLSGSPYVPTGPNVFAFHIDGDTLVEQGLMPLEKADELLMRGDISGDHAVAATDEFLLFFERTAGGWQHGARFPIPFACVGCTFKDAAIDGDTVIASVTRGSKHKDLFYSRAGGTWVLAQDLTVPDHATAVDIVGDTAIATNDWDGVTVYRRNAGTWAVETVVDISDGQLGEGVTLVDANTLAVETKPSGAPQVVSIYARDAASGTWTLSETLATPAVWYGGFGWSLAASGNTLVISSENAPATRVYERNGTTWTQTALLASDDPATEEHFGQSVAICGDLLMVGSPDGAGVVYLYERDGTSWQRIARAGTTEYSSVFGSKVACSGNATLVMGHGSGFAPSYGSKHGMMFFGQADDPACVSDADCDDGIACTDDVCDMGTSVCTHTPNCDDGDPCTLNTCDPVAGCVASSACDDGDACTDDQCLPGGVCVPFPVNCDDTDPCTDDFCDPVGGCFHSATNCDDNDPCTGTETCVPFQGCAAGTPVDCDDGDMCTDDSCDSDLGCLNLPAFCRDGDPCTQDSCVAPTGCSYAPVPGCSPGPACSDDAECNGTSYCDTYDGTCRVLPCGAYVRQGDTVIPYAGFASGSATAAAWYGLVGGSATLPQATADTAVFAIHRDNSGQLAFVLVQDTPNNPSGTGTTAWDIFGLASGVLTVTDDASDPRDTYDLSGSFTWVWGATTDGMVVEIDGDYCIEATLAMNGQLFGAGPGIRWFGYVDALGNVELLPSADETVTLCVNTACGDCINGTQDGDETDVDCGGASCDQCADGLGCASDADCQSDTCSGGVCAAAATCDDGVTNGDETGVDCGGPTCSACADGQGCAADGDCQSGLCVGDVCEAAPSCNDGVQNGDEVGVDCGGAFCPACPGNGGSCATDADCGPGVYCDVAAATCRELPCGPYVRQGDLVVPYGAFASGSPSAASWYATAAVPQTQVDTAVVGIHEDASGQIAFVLLQDKVSNSPNTGTSRWDIVGLEAGTLVAQDDPTTADPRDTYDLTGGEFSWTWGNARDGMAVELDGEYCVTATLTDNAQLYGTGVGITSLSYIGLDGSLVPFPSLTEAVTICVNVDCASCDDGEQNGIESGVDCGGRCDACGPPGSCVTDDQCSDGQYCDSSVGGCRQLPCGSYLRQGSTVLSAPPFTSGEASAADWYGFSGGSGAPPQAMTDTAVIAIHQDTGGQLAFVLVQDEPGNGTGTGRATWDISGLEGGNLVVTDDPSTYDSRDSYDLSAGSFTWTWGNASDGMAVEVDGDYCITATLTDNRQAFGAGPGLTTMATVDENGGLVPLPSLSAPVTLCVNAVCSTCNNGIQDGDETDVDCGGSCGTCGDGLGCGVAGDCDSGVCGGGLCASPSCDDGVQNGAETGVDCGGVCADCPPPGSCFIDAHCGTDQFCGNGATTCLDLPCSAYIRQGDFVAAYDGFISGEATVADWYGFTGGTSSAPQAMTDTAVVGLHEDAAGKLAFVLLQDEPGNTTGTGQTEWSITGLEAGTLVVEDDPTALDVRDAYDLASGTFRWTWGTVTDGMAVEVGSNYCITATLTDNGQVFSHLPGLTTMAFIDAAGAVVPLPSLTEPVTLCQPTSCN